jgi:glycosyltransferase involved in cell wall biosynthesis
MIDDASTDGTKEWIDFIQLHNMNVRSFSTNKREGHTWLYDEGIAKASNDIVGILHADMIIGPNYVENMVKHLKPGKVVCATRVEPPLHPSGPEKITMDFGTDYGDLNIKAFEDFCVFRQNEDKDEVTKGMFAPWIIYKEDFERIGGHDPIFAPFPFEDSDIFQRWILQGYELIQSRDALVYHLTCRGHRWTGQIGVDDDYYKMARDRGQRNYLRKWGSWIENDEYQYPIMHPKYDIAFNIEGTGGTQIIGVLEPWCSMLYVNDLFDMIIPSYIETEQSNTTYDLKERIRDRNKCVIDNHDIVVEFDASNMDTENFKSITLLPQIIETAEPGFYELGILKIDIRRKVDRRNELIFIKNKTLPPWMK